MKEFHRRVCLVPALVGSGLLLACGGDGGPSSPPPVIGVSVSPSTTTVGAGETRDFTASVTNSTQGVTWSVTGGTISSTGTTATFTAPTAGGTYTVRATSVEDATKSGTASATVTPVVIALSPASRAAYRGEPVTVTATVTGSSLNGVTWTASCGGVTGTGSAITWTAPDTIATCTVTARSVLDATATAAATMTVRPVWRVSNLTETDDGACTFAHCSLREAINAANAQPNADSIQFQVAAGAFGNTPSTITLTSALPVITTTMHIVGPGPDVLTINAAATTTNQRRVLEVNGATASVTGVRLRGGIATNGAGLVAHNGANVTLTNVMVVENESRNGDGAGILVYSSQATLNQVIVESNKVVGTNFAGAGLTVAANAVVTITGGRVKDNVVENGFAGGIRQLDSKLTMTGTTVEGNQVLAGTAGGGGILAEGTSTLTLDNVTLTANASPAGEGGGLRVLASVTGSIANSTISNNTANSGAGIVFGNVGTFSVTGTTITGNTSATRVGGVWLWGTSDVSFTNCTISSNVAQAGPGGGMYLQNTAKARLTGGTIASNKVRGMNQSGGGVFALDGTSVTMNGGIVEKNETESGFGAGIYAQAATVALTGVAIRENTGGVAIGAGMAVIFGSTLTMTGGSVTANIATGAAGGGILINASNATITNVTFQDNDADVQGGAVQMLSSPGTVTMSNVTFRNNHSDGFGGAIGLFGGMVLNISNGLFEGNSTGTSGGAIGKSETSQLTVTDSRFISNTATLQGAAAQLAGTGNATIQRSTFTGNTAVTGGGAVTIGSSALIEASTFIGNSSGTAADPASGQGGAIFSGSTSTTTIRNSTISGNTATTLGGGISVTGQATLVNVSIVGNTATTIGAGIASNNAGAVQISNSLLTGNMMGVNPLNCGVAVTAQLTSQGYNLSDNLSCATFIQPTDKLNTAPGINTTLADNGGPTRTHAVLTGSALINAANPTTCPATDQRGFSRQGICDIGAFEFGGTAPAPRVASLIGTSGQPPRSIRRTAPIRRAVIVPDPRGNGGVPIPDSIR